MTGEEMNIGEEEEDYDKFEIEQELDPILLETIPSDIVATLQSIYSREEASRYLRDGLKVKKPAPDDKDRESVMHYLHLIYMEHA